METYRSSLFVRERASSCARFAFLFAILLILQAARRHRFARWHLHFALPLLIRPFASSARCPTVQVAWLPDCWSPTFLYLFSLFCCYADGLHVSLNQLINGYPQRLCVSCPSGFSADSLYGFTTTALPALST